LILLLKIDVEPLPWIGRWREPMQQVEKLAAIQPRLVPRECGGWLALSPDAALRIGVTAPTELEAREAFRHALNRWIETLRAV
jgi:hypothetical protein